jgi:D-alanyl-D-alanine carboxypeptidase
MVEMAAADSPRFAPGTQAEYNNTNYILLGMIIEKAGGMSVTDYFSEVIAQTSWAWRTPIFPRIKKYRSLLCGATPPGRRRSGIGNLVSKSFYSPSSSWTAGGMIGNVGRSLKMDGCSFVRQSLEPGMHGSAAGFFQCPATDDYGLGVMRGGTLIGHAGEVPG